MDTDFREEEDGSSQDPYGPPKGRALKEFLPMSLKGKYTTIGHTGGSNEVLLREAGDRRKV